jgi:hypothetical protein
VRYPSGQRMAFPAPDNDPSHRFFKSAVERRPSSGLSIPTQTGGDHANTYLYVAFRLNSDNSALEMVALRRRRALPIAMGAETAGIAGLVGSRDRASGCCRSGCRRTAGRLRASSAHLCDHPRRLGNSWSAADCRFGLEIGAEVGDRRGGVDGRACDVGDERRHLPREGSVPGLRPPADADQVARARTADRKSPRSPRRRRRHPPLTSSGYRCQCRRGPFVVG